MRNHSAEKGSRCARLLHSLIVLTILLVTALPAEVPAATITKANNTTILSAKGSWVSGSKVPGVADIALWDSTVTGANTTSLGANLSWLGIQITNPGGAVTISAGNTLTLGSSGINMSAATQNLTLNCALTLGSSQVWDVTTGRTVAATGIIGGSGGLTKNSLGTATLTGVNTYTGGTIINGGVVQINSASSLGASTGAATINAGTLELLVGNTISSSRLFKLGNAASTLQVDSGSSWTIGTVISNAGTTGSLVKTGAGILILSSSTGNTYGGAGQTTSINAGTLQVGADNVLGNSANTVTFNGGTLLFSSGFTSSRGVVMTGAGTINTNNNAATLSGVVSGSGTLTKTGAGTLTLSGTNTYSGGTTITGGNSSVVSIAGAANLGSGAVTVNGGSVLMSTADLTLTHGIVLGAQGGGNQPDGNPVSGILNVASGTTLTIATGVISETTSGTGRLEILGGGTVLMTTANSYGGGTYLHAGTLVVANPFALGSATPGNTLTIDNGAQLALGASNVFNAPVYVGNGGAVLGSLSPSNVGFDNAVVSNLTGQTGGFTVNNGTFGAGGVNTFTGNITINSGAALSISRDANLGAATNQLSLANNATLKIEDGVNIVSNTSVQATFATSRQFNLIGGTATIEVDNTNNAINTLPSALGAHTNVLTVNGLVTGAGGLVKSGAGTLILTNAGNNYAGGTIINAGILSTADPAALGDASSSLTINPTGIYQATASFASSRLVILGGTGGSSSGGTFDVTSGVVEDRDGVISGSGSLTKTGAGTLTLSAANTFTGDFYINGGTVSIANNQALGPQPPSLGSALYAVHMANGTTLQAVVSSFAGNRQLELVSGTATLDVTGGFTQQRNGLVYGSGGLIKTGTGTQILTNANTYSGGTTINAGVLQVNNTSGSGTGTGTVGVNSGGTLSGAPTATGFTNPGSISGTVTVNSGGVIDVRSGGTFTFGGLTLNTSAITNFQLGASTTTAVINVTGTNSLSLAGLSTINIANFAGGLAAGTYHLIDYTGTALTNLNNLQLGSTAGGAFTYSLSNNTTNTSIDLLVSTSSTQWANDANGNWGTNASWTNNISPNSVGAVANFLGVINNPRTVTVDGAFTAGNLTFDDANSYTIAGDGVTGHGITLDSNGTADINVLNGSHTISAPISLTDNLEIIASSGTSLTISGPISENTGGRTLITSGVGTVTFSGAAANTYTGLTDIDAGTLNLNKTAGVNAIGTGGLQIDPGATVALLASNQIADTASVAVNGTLALGTSSETIGSLTGSGSVTLGAGSTLTIGASNNLDSDFDGIISGAGSITKSGTGSAEFDAVNTFGGAGQTVTLLGGSLEVFADSNLGNAANSITFNGGTELFGAGFSSARAVILTGSGTFDTNNVAATLSGTISGTGTLTKKGEGILTLSGTNSYSGGTFLSAGGLSITSNGNLGTGSVQFNNGATLVTNGSFSFTHGFVLGAPSGPVQADGLAVSGIIDVQSGTLTETTNGITDGGAGGRLMKIGAGTLDLQVGSAAVGGNTAFSGGTYIHEGTLIITTAGANGTSAVTTIDNSATLIANLNVGGVVSVGQFKIGTGGAFIGETSGKTSFGNGAISDVSGQSGGITFVGPGKTGLGGNNTFVGTVVIGNPATPLVHATLSISRDVNLGSAANQLSISDGSTLMIEDGIDATQSVGSAALAATFSTSRQINLTGSTAIIDVENTGDAVNYNSTFNPGGLNTLAAHVNVLTIDGLITGSGGLVKNGAGTLILTNTSDSYTGGTTINAGTLSTADGASLGDASHGLTINPTGISQVTGTFTTSRLTTLGGSGGASSGGTFEITSANINTRTGVIDGSGSLTKIGTGTLSLLGANTYTGGTYINDGTIAINNNASLGNASGAATIANATLEAVSDVTTTRNFAITSANSTFQIDAGATYDIGGIVSGAGTLNKTGDGILALNGSNTYTGGTTINAGTIAVNSASSLGPTTYALALNAGTLDVVAGFSTSRNIALGNAASTIQVDAGQTYSVSGVISGSGALNKNGTGTLTLTGANTFSGATIINAGTLAASAPSGSALANTSAITVNVGGTLLLGASNQIGSATPLNLAGGSFATGGFSQGTASSVGMGALTLTDAGSHIDFGTGAVGLLNIASFDPGGELLLIDNWTGTSNTVGNASTDRLIFNTDQTANLGSFSFAGYSSAVEFNLGSGFYEIAGLGPVPEPSTWFAAALTFLALVYHQRRRLLHHIARRRNGSPR